MGRRLQKFFAVFAILTFVFTFPLSLLAALFIGLPTAIGMVIIGYLILIPLAMFLGRVSGDVQITEVVEATLENRPIDSVTDETQDPPDPLETLRDQFANGEIDQEEFERKVDTLLESEHMVENNLSEKAKDEASTDGKKPDYEFEDTHND